ncbi:hypothetical protein HYH02_004089 [Chlamydomonas schloesseri]|uniref:TLC domain-containing protein n=1 Tax=Chlamydomonas schloesseri TaxID=2026947 RepID=A0A836B958_9CHLO|nr:hypothetical protein HYH02_004089 [Chlamydomonas schloesseri]|eukprot:KAG2451491.1 hypothetical protein HYH02_004089 [Chlamydomonas schloesseri]
MLPGIGDAFSQLYQLLFDYDALRLVAPRGDVEYEAWFAVRARDLAAYNQLYALLAPSVLLCAGLCLLRVAFVHGVLLWADAGATGGRSSYEALDEGRASTPPGAAVSGGKDVADAATPGAATATDVELRWAEGFWTAAGGMVLLIWSWRCVVTSNGGCPGLPGLLDTSSCLAGWPLLPVELAVRRYYSAELAWYMHLLLKHRLGVGLHDSGLIVAHHIATVYLLLLSYCFSLTRPGVLLLALLNLSSPLLHVSKIAHAAGSKRLALVSFASFAAVFAASRVVLFPLIFLPLGLISSQRYIGRLLQLYPFTFGLVNALLVALVAMQWGWFVAIVRIIRQAASGDAARLERSAAHMEAAAASSGGSSSSNSSPADSGRRSPGAAVVVARPSRGHQQYGAGAEGVGEEEACDGGHGVGAVSVGVAAGGIELAGAGTAGGSVTAAVDDGGRSRPAEGMGAAPDAGVSAPGAASAAPCWPGAAVGSGKAAAAAVTGHAWQVHASSASSVHTLAPGPRSAPVVGSPGGSGGSVDVGGGAGAGRGAAQMATCGALSDGIVSANQPHYAAGQPQSPDLGRQVLSRPPGLRLRA